MLKRLITPASIICILAFLLLLLPLREVLPFWRTLQQLPSPDGNHTVKLVRQDGIDRNYSIYVDGKRVYISPDFAPRDDISFQEALRWDAAGSIVVLEVAKQRLFGFDVRDDRPLSDDELLAVELAPEPELWEYYFEDEWPGVGRARRPEATREGVPRNGE
jgi:hypothetical protein